MYKIIKTEAEIKGKNRKEIKAYCTIQDEYPEEIKEFKEEREAIKELRKEQYKPNCRYDPYHKIYEITEYLLKEEIGIDGEDYTGYDSVYDFEFNEEENNIKIKEKEYYTTILK